MTAYFMPACARLPRPGPRVVEVGVELVEVLLVVRVGHPLVLLHPLVARRQRVEAPVDEHAEARVGPPLQARLLLRRRFGGQLGRRLPGGGEAGDGSRRGALRTSAVCASGSSVARIITGARLLAWGAEGLSAGGDGASGRCDGSVKGSIRKVTPIWHNCRGAGRFVPVRAPRMRRPRSCSRRAYEESCPPRSPCSRLGGLPPRVRRELAVEPQQFVLGHHDDDRPRQPRAWVPATTPARTASAATRSRSPARPIRPTA